MASISNLSSYAMTTLQKLASASVAGALVLGGGAIAGYASLAGAQAPSTADGAANTAPWGMHEGGLRGRMGGMTGERGVIGTVSAVNGSTITVTGKDGASYTVDASGSKVSKIVELAVGDIKVGDTVGVMGSVTGTSVTAKHIMDGIPPAPSQGGTR